MISVVKWMVLMSVVDIFLKMVLNWMVVVWIVLMKMVVMAWSSQTSHRVSSKASS